MTGRQDEVVVNERRGALAGRWIGSKPLRRCRAKIEARLRGAETFIVDTNLVRPPSILQRIHDPSLH